MSTKYPGGIISKTAPTPSGPYADSTAPGIWTLEQQAYWQKLGQWPTQGNVNPSAFIENLFSTYLYTGNGTGQTITNGINISGNGGLVWIKNRTQAGYYHVLTDTARGANKQLYSNATDAQYTTTLDITSFTSTGFVLGADSFCNQNNAPNASWTFRKQPKFFDVVTYTGDGTSGRTVSHSLASVPGFIVIKSTSSGGNWAVAARKSDGTYAYGATSYAFGFNTTEQATSRSVSGLATSTTFTPDSVADVGTCNNTGVTYVAYLFAHNAGGFGLTGTDNVISCSSFTTDGSGNATIDLGYEAQWVLTKKVSGTGGPWGIYDTMRGWSYSAQNYLLPNSSGAEGVINGSNFHPTATGFTTSSPYDASSTYIYIAIRRGPMKVPTSGTSVFSPNTTTNDTVISTTGFPVDLCIEDIRTPSSYPEAFDRLRGSGIRLLTSSTDAEGNTGTNPQFQSNTGVTPGRNGSGVSCILWNFGRAPSFFDEVCYTGTGTATTQTHNLGVVPELMMVKARSSSTYNWQVYHSALGNSQAICTNLDIAAYSTVTQWNATTPTSTVFSIGSSGATNVSGVTYVAYLFATCAGVSKVGSYTGTGTTKQVDCGFTGGARFVLIKRTDSTGDWYVWDSARGIVAGNDPYLLLNSTAAEVTNTDYVDTYSAGFEISSTAPAAINANGGTFIFLAIA